MRAVEQPYLLFKTIFVSTLFTHNTQPGLQTDDRQTDGRNIVP